MIFKQLLTVLISIAIYITTEAKPIVVLQPGDDPVLTEDAIIYCGDPSSSTQKFYQCSISRCKASIPDKDFFCKTENKWTGQLTGHKTKKFIEAKESAIGWANGSIYRNLFCNLITIDEIGNEIKRVSIPNVDIELPDLR